MANHPREWPDKALFSAMLLVLAGFVGALFQVVRPLIEVDQERMPTIFTDEIPFYTLTLSLAALTFGTLSLRYQAAVFAYLGAAAGILSLGVFGLVPALSLVAIGFMVKSHVEGEETRFDRHTVRSTLWPDKAMASSLIMTVVGGIAVTQATLMLTGHFDPILLTGRPGLAATIGLTVGALLLVAGREVYNLRRPWLGWTALGLGCATLGFYVIGPLLALTGMVLLGLAHREDEFLVHAPEALDA
jgi:hypothetical protein